MADYYSVLGIAKTASDAEIKKAFRAKAMQYHPDRNQGDTAAEEQFKKVNEAYAVLSDAKKRKQYDMFGDQQFHQQYSSEDIFRGTDFGSIFEEFGLGGGFFNSFFQGGGRQQYGGGSAKGADVEYPIEIGFMEAYQGSERQISFRLSDGTQRQLKIKIPAGLQPGSKLRVAGKGAPSNYGGGPGDLYVIISIAAHPDFRLVGEDVETDISIKISEGLLGCSKSVATLDGEKIIKIPAGVRPGTKIRLKNMGFPVRGGRGQRGHLFAVVQFAGLPDELSKEQMAALESLREVGL